MSPAGFEPTAPGLGIQRTSQRNYPQWPTFVPFRVLWPRPAESADSQLPLLTPDDRLLPRGKSVGTLPDPVAHEIAPLRNIQAGA
jgi:hypothetical protein